MKAIISNEVLKSFKSKDTTCSLTLDFPNSGLNIYFMKKGEYIVLNPEISGKILTFLITLTGEEFKGDKFYSCPQIRLFDRVLTENEIKKLST